MNWFIKISVCVFFIANYITFARKDYNKSQGVEKNTRGINKRRAYNVYRENIARKRYFNRYAKLLYDVEKLKRLNAKNARFMKKTDSEKPSIINIGLYTYMNIVNTFKFFKKVNNNGVPYFNLDPNSNEDFPMYVHPIFAGGGVIDINFSKHTGMSIVGAYTLFQRNKKDKIIAFENGISLYLLFRTSGLRFPFNYVFDIGPNIIDPIFWILKIIGVVYKVDLLIGVKFSFYGNVQPGSLNPDFKNNTFKDFSNFYKKSNKTITDKIFPIINEFMVFERRVYITEHVFYNVNSTMVIPIIISWLQTNCKETWNWIKTNWAEFFLNVTFGVVF